MGMRRGLSNQDRLGVNMVAVTAAGYVLGANARTPLFLYSVAVSKRNATASAQIILADTTSSGDTVADAILIVNLQGSTNATGGGENNFTQNFNPPVYIQDGLDLDITTTADVSVSYLEAS